MKVNVFFKKGLLMVAAILFTVTGALAQFSVGPEISLPMATPFSDNAGAGFGGSVNYQGAINDNLSWVGYVGFLTWSGKNLPVGVTSASSTMIPINAGVKYYFTESGSGFYGEVDLGIFLLSGSNSGPGGSVSLSETNFGFTPALGYRVGSFDIGARYNIVSGIGGVSANNLSFRLAYVFGGGN